MMRVSKLHRIAPAFVPGFSFLENKSIEDNFSKFVGAMKPSTEFHLQYDPAEITTLAEEYMKHSAQYDKEMEDAGKRIATGDYSHSTLEIVCRWKSDRRIALLSTNTGLEIERALKRAISADDIKDAVHSLTALHGVGVKMASAILTAIDPERYTVLDFRALEALGLDDNDDLDFYVLYVGACRRLATTYRVSLRTFDRANWQWSKRKSKSAASRTGG